MSSNLRHIWANKSVEVPQLSAIKTLKAWCLACHPSSFIVYVLAISLAFYLAQKPLEQAPYCIYFMTLGAFFCMHAAMNMLCDLFDYIEEKKSSHASIVEQGLLSPRSITLSIMGLTMACLISGAWLVAQSGQPWPCFLLFICIFSAIVYGTSSRRHGLMSFGNSFLTFNVALGMLAVSYAVITHDFTPYMLTITVPVALLVAGIIHYQWLESKDKDTVFCKHIASNVFGKERVSHVFRFAGFSVWVLLLNLILGYGPMTTIELKPMDKSLLEQHSSATIQAYTQDAMERGVTYGFGAKDSHKGSVDCSGWITEINQKMMQAMNASVGSEVYGQKAKLTLSIGANGGAAGLILAVKVVTDELLLNEDLSPDKVREGLTIGLDTGVKDWDIGRFAGIDHIVQTYKDQKTGQMRVSQSSGGIGVHSMPYDEWYPIWNEAAKLYGVDMSLLADQVPAL